jgi:hypothetical protein
MTYKGDPIAEKLDKLAEATGIPQFQARFRHSNPIRFRVLPLVLIALATVGLILQMTRGQTYGYVLIIMVWSATTMVFALGPLGRRTNRRLDEREAAVVRQGHFTGLIVAFGVAVLGSLAFGLGKMGAMIHLWDIWAPASGLDWLAITFFLLNLEANVAVIAASAATPEPLEDDDED